MSLIAGRIIGGRKNPSCAIHEANIDKCAFWALDKKVMKAENVKMTKRVFGFFN